MYERNLLIILTKRRCCIVLNEHNTVFAQSSPLYATGISLSPPASSTQTASRSLQPFLQGSLGDRPTDRPTDHATRSVTIGGAHSGETKFCYCLWLKQVFIAAVDSNTPCLPFFVSVHQMAPPVTEVGDIQLQLTSNSISLFHQNKISGSKKTKHNK